MLDHGTSSGLSEGWMYGEEPASSFCVKITTWKSISLLRSFVGNYHILVNFSNLSNLEKSVLSPFLPYFIYRSSTFHSHGAEYLKSK